MNKVMLIGNVGRDPEVKYVDAGVEVPERTEWHNVVLWRKLAEVVEKYVHKGDKLFIEGQIHTRTYDDQNGIRRTVTEIWAESLEMLSPKPQTPEQPQNQ